MFSKVTTNKGGGQQNNIDICPKYRWSAKDKNGGWITGFPSLKTLKEEIDFILEK